MDDIQFFSNKEKSQEELFHLFNYLYDNNKQIIFSSDKHPHYIQNLEERLKSRFNAGMIVDIPAPDHESRLAIIKAKASHHKIDISEDIAIFLAQTIESNIREIEGVINSLIMNTQIRGRALNINEVKNIIKSSGKPKKNISSKEVIKTVAQFYDVEEKSIYEKSRKKEVVRPRQVIMYILREDFEASYPSIGEKLGGRDHTTVIHSCEKIKNDIKESPILAEEIERIRSMLQC
jgi:chromosomal replication initiator protein